MGSSELKTFEFPQCWEDDVRMNSLFAPFRARNINPTDWDSKMKFWDSLIEQWCTHHKTPLVDLSVLNDHFRRKGKVPSCLPEVIENMSRNKTVVTKDVFYQMTEQNWKNWALQILITNPLRWTLNRVKRTVTRDSDNALTLFVHVPAIQKLGLEIFKNIPASCRGKLLDGNCIQNIADVKNGEVIHLLLQWLYSRKLIAIQPNQKNLLVKFAKEENESPVITDVDKALFSLEQNKKMLENKVEALENEKDHLLAEAKKHVAAKKVSLAKTALRRKKTLENVINKLSSGIENIESLMYQMQMAEMDSVILQCYETGVSTLNKYFKESGLTKDRVLSTRNELEEVLILKTDIDDALSDSLGGQMPDESVEELEEELKKLLDEDADEGAVKSKSDEDSILSRLPEVPSHDPKMSDNEEKLEEKMASLAL